MQNPVSIITAKADLDVHETRKIARAIDALIEQRQNKIVIECSGADWIDPLALGMLMACHHALVSAGGELKFARTNKMIRGIFWKFGVDELFEDYERLEDALLSFDEEWDAPTARMM